MYVQLREFTDYVVTDDGRVFSLRYGFKEMKTSNIGGYRKVNLRKDGKAYKKLVHRLVMEAFHGPSDLVVNHINADRADNRLENLEYCTVAENNRHTIALGRMPKARSRKPRVCPHCNHTF